MIKLNIQKYTLFLVLIFVSFFTVGQDKNLVGKVTVFDSIPLVGVDVKVKSTKQTVKTDSLGRFQVFCNPEDKLEIKAAGFYPKKVTVEKGIRMMFVNLSLKSGSNNLNKAERYANVGYGYVNTKRLANAVGTLNTNDLDFSMYNDIYDLIKGRFSGVTVSGNEIIIRGVKTFQGVEGNSALLVVDGIIVDKQDFANISPLDVQSVDVLKDGSSSVYGSRGANGVVIVETKKGK
ncbi:MAG TPA: TonB-dependent receptor plug domain-containing protein [Draconibacterium sp.]|jgi:TonB-dependent SusC/RagA subfamily outer membrane receptor|nr:TonB-dependent receptor plug domain-containing protein [Draconibacterium sp.]